MLTDKQKRLLENRIYEIAKRYLTEWSDRSNDGGRSKNKQKDLGLKSGTKRNTVRRELDKPTVNKAAIAYNLYNSGENDKPSDRSLLYKKLHQRDDHDFTDNEINKIASIMGID